MDYLSNHFTKGMDKKDLDIPAYILFGIVVFIVFVWVLYRIVDCICCFLERRSLKLQSRLVADKADAMENGLLEDMEPKEGSGKKEEGKMTGGVEEMKAKDIASERRLG